MLKKIRATPVENSTEKSKKVKRMKIKEVLHRTSRLPLFDKARSTQKTTRPNFVSIVARVFLSAVTFLRSRCLAMIGGYTCRYTD
jgi:hypothetical protein